MARTKKTQRNGTPRPRRIPALAELSESDDDKPLKRRKTVDHTDDVKASNNEVMTALEKPIDIDDSHEDSLSRSFAHSLLESCIKDNWPSCAEKKKKEFGQELQQCEKVKSCLRLTKDKMKDVIRDLDFSVHNPEARGSYANYVKLVKIKVDLCINNSLRNMPPCEACTHCL